MHNFFNRKKIVAAALAAAFLAPALASAQYNDSTQYGSKGLSSATLWDANGFGSQMQTIVNQTVNIANTANNNANNATSIANNATNVANNATNIANTANTTAAGAAAAAASASASATVPGFWTPNINNPVVAQGICSATSHSYYPGSTTTLAAPTYNPQNGGSGYWPAYSTRQVCPSDMPWFYQISTFIYDTSNQGGGT